MNRKKIRTTLCALLALAGLTAIASTASGGAGSQADPLVTLSYLTETFTGQVMERVDERIVQRNAALSAELGGAYAAVTLSAGQTLYGEAGCEVLLRSGAASCAAASAPASTRSRAHTMLPIFGIRILGRDDPRNRHAEIRNKGKEIIKKYPTLFHERPNFHHRQAAFAHDPPPRAATAPRSRPRAVSL